jgi:predicted DCC family thiol-disulfide oxidoreductase YuxK
LRFPWNLTVIGWIIPGFLRDHLYKWIARNRYRWFGKRGYCRIPDKNERELFLSVDDLQSIFSF